MTELDCKICFYPMDKNKFLPRILNCGHTFCSQCISELIESSKNCPTCRRSFNSESINDYPVNHIVLELKYSAKDLEKNKGLFLKKYKTKLSTLKGKLEEIKPFVTNLEGLLEGGEKQLKKLIDSSDDIDSVSKDAVRDIENTLDTVLKQIKLFSTPQLASVSLQFQDCKPDFDVIAEIRKGITDRKTLAAVSLINGIKKFARISLKDNFLFIHTFQTIQELDEDEDDIFTVSFVDLQNCLFKANEKKNIYGFLDLVYQTKSSGHRVIIEVLKSSMDLGSSFLKFCMGENDISYKDCNYSQKYNDKVTSDHSSATLNSHIKSVDVDKVIQIKKLNCGGKSFIDESTYSRYLDSNLSISGCTFHECFLSFKKDGALEIFKLHNNASVAVTKKSAQNSLFSNQDTYSRFCDSCGNNFTPHNRRPFLDSSGNLITLSDDFYYVPNVIGRILDVNKNFESTFKNATFGKVLDCGIAFAL